MNDGLTDELDRLRRRVHGLCKKVQSKSSTSDREERDKLQASKELGELEQLIKQARNAKLEALEYTGHGRAELVEEVKRLYGILQEAKEECDGKDDRITYLEQQVELLRKQNTQLLEKIGSERSHFAQVLRDERTKYNQRLQNLIVQHEESKT